MCWLHARYFANFISFGFQNLLKKFGGWGTCPESKAAGAGSSRDPSIPSAEPTLAITGLVHPRLTLSALVTEGRILGQVDLCSKTNVNGNWKIQESDVVRDWGRREESVPSATLTTEKVRCAVSLTSGQKQAWGSPRRVCQCVYWKINLSRLRQVFKINKRIILPICNLVRDTLPHQNHKGSNTEIDLFIFLNFLNQNLSPYGLGAVRAKNIIPESQIRAEH